MSATSSACWAVLPAAGIGSRMGGQTPKQYLEIAGSTLFEHSLQALLDCPQIVTVMVALHRQDQQAASIGLLDDKRVQTVAGGAQRSDSVLAALDALAQMAAPTDWVLVHDAARPCLQGADTARLIDLVTSTGQGGILAEPIVDTVKQAGDDGLVAATVDRSKLWRAQTPQMFRLGELRSALGEAIARGLPVTDEASAMEMAGHPVQLLAGSRSNLKVTVPEDLSLAGWYLQQAGSTPAG